MKANQEPQPPNNDSQAAEQAKPTVPVAPGPPRPAGTLFFKWFLSGTVRDGCQLAKHVHKLLCAQKDILKPEAVGAVQAGISTLRGLCASGDSTAVKDGMVELEKVANKWLKPFPFQGVRENIEVLLVAIAVAMAIRTFFLQPFKIPTGSMQPTLWGITSNPDFLHHPPLSDDLAPKPDFTVPNPFQRFVEYWVNGVSYTHVVARSDGALAHADEKPFSPLVIFNLNQRFWLENDPKPYTIWFPTDDLFQRSGLLTGYGPNRKVFKKGEDIIKIRSVTGDHLFVDRLTYNFRHPDRGEIIVFETKHIQHSQVPQDQFYIKRLVGLGGEKLRINQDRRLVVNDVPLTPNTPRFENLYGYHPEYKPNDYFGHSPREMFAGDREYQVPPNSYVAMGDNTENSLDSRYWGALPQEDVIGKAWFVYWPFSSRWGWGYR